ncbi:MAG TPA: maleylpyruvate isomerase family mycothiol-dependent enzyme [Pseudonocardiaceae bacterium]
MEHLEFVEQARIHAEGLRAAALAAGPDATVPTCPEWDVHRLVRHIARVHAWVIENLRTADPEDPKPAPRPPEDWTDLLSWWDERLAELLETLRDTDPATPAWVFSPFAPPTAGFWPRRMAHETAVHRLDAEHALAALHGGPDARPGLAFDPGFAADGVDEALTRIVPAHITDWARSRLRGTVRYHAVDAGRSWLVHVAPEQLPETTAYGSAPETPEADAGVSGAADELYRAVWGRPHRAEVAGEMSLVEAVRAR